MAEPQQVLCTRSLNINYKVISAEYSKRNEVEVHRDRLSGHLSYVLDLESSLVTGTGVGSSVLGLYVFGSVNPYNLMGALQVPHPLFLIYATTHSPPLSSRNITKSGCLAEPQNQPPHTTQYGQEQHTLSANLLVSTLALSVGLPYNLSLFLFSILKET